MVSRDPTAAVEVLIGVRTVAVGTGGVGTIVVVEGEAAKIGVGTFALVATVAATEAIVVTEVEETIETRQGAAAGSETGETAAIEAGAAVVIVETEGMIRIITVIALTLGLLARSETTIKGAGLLVIGTAIGAQTKELRELM
jgi:hypothetical protein